MIIIEMDDNNLGAILKMCMNHKDLSQGKVSNRTGMKQGKISEFVNSKEWRRDPRLKTINKLFIKGCQVKHCIMIDDDKKELTFLKINAEKA